MILEFLWKYANVIGCCIALYHHVNLSMSSFWVFGCPLSMQKGVIGVRESLHENLSNSVKTNGGK